jgi:hypothetical protein
MHNLKLPHRKHEFEASVQHEISSLGNGGVRSDRGQMCLK